MKKVTEKHNQNEGLKSLRLELENFKNIEHKAIEIGGHSMIILGKNNSGKSTLIQGMMSPMDAKLLPTEPIKKGEERARISHTIGGNIQGDYHEYILDLFFTQKDKKGRLVVTNKDGEAQKSPATLLKNIIGNVSFDVTKWLNDTKANKLKTIKALTGCEKEIDVINRDIEELKSSAKSSKDRADDLEATLKNHEFTQSEVEKYSTAADISSLQEEMRTISQKQSQWDSIKNKVDGFHREVADYSSKITTSENEISRLQNLIKQEQLKIEDLTKLIGTADGNITRGMAWLEATARPAIDEVNARLTSAVEHNEKFNRVATLSNQHKEMINLRGIYAEKKGEIEKLVEKRSALINSSQLPIEGLTFTDDDILINGLPLEEGQINTATLFDVGVEVAMALNPNLKIIFLHDGSLFDRDGLKSIVNKIESRGYMAIIEVVAENSDVEAVFTESYLA